MPVERAAVGTSVIDVLDRVLDKGIVIDARLRESPAGIDLVSDGTRVVVASAETYLKYDEVVGRFAAASRPAYETTTTAGFATDTTAMEGEHISRGAAVPAPRRTRML